MDACNKEHFVKTDFFGLNLNDFEIDADFFALDSIHLEIDTDFFAFDSLHFYMDARFSWQTLNRPTRLIA